MKLFHAHYLHLKYGIRHTEAQVDVLLPSVQTSWLVRISANRTFQKQSLPSWSLPLLDLNIYYALN